MNKKATIFYFIHLVIVRLYYYCIELIFELRKGYSLYKKLKLRTLSFNFFNFEPQT